MCQLALVDAGSRGAVDAVDRDTRPFLSCQLSREPVHVRHAREQARRALFEWGLGEHAELIVSELVTNALRDGEGKIQVRMSHVGGDLRVAFHDSGAGRPVKHQPTVEGESEGARHSSTA